MIEAFYETLLLRDPDTQGIAYWQHQLGAAEAIVDIALAFVMSDEFQANMDELLDRNDWLALV